MENQVVTKVKNELQSFSFDDMPVRIITINSEPWWVAKDVAEILEYSWDGKGTIEHVPEEWRGVGLIPTPSGMQNMAILSEQGLYFFLNRSNKPKALPFQKWNAGDLLPKLRKNGFYGTPQISTPSTFIEALEALVQSEKAKELALQTVHMQSALLIKQAPDAKFAQVFLNSAGEKLFSIVAKEINTKKVLKCHIGPKTICEFLRYCGIIHKISDNHRFPTYGYEKYFNVLPRLVDGKNYSETKVNTEGERFIFNLCIREYDTWYTNIYKANKSEVQHG